MTHYAESLSNNIHIFAKPSCNRNPCLELVLKKIPIYLLTILMTLKYYFSSVSVLSYLSSISFWNLYDMMLKNPTNPLWTFLVKKWAIFGRSSIFALIAPILSIDEANEHILVVYSVTYPPEGMPYPSQGISYG